MVKQNEQEQNTKGHHGQSNKRHKLHYYGVLAVRFLFCFVLFRSIISVSGAGAATSLPGPALQRALKRAPAESKRTAKPL